VDAGGAKAWPDNMTSLPRLNALWVGGSLGRLGNVCLASALAVGHSVSLYTYHGVTNVPAGIKILDARDVLPEERLTRYKASGSFALGSNIFRYELMKRGLGCWIDADVYFLQPLNFAADSHIFGWEDQHIVGSAVLQIPQKSPLLADLLAFVSSNPVVPPWWTPYKRLGRRILGMQGRAPKLEDLPWGTAGPLALTHYIKKNRLTAHAAEPDVFFPIHWSQAEEIFAPDAAVRSRFTSRTKTVHLWNAKIQHRKEEEITPSSFFGQICRGDARRIADEL
jgi:Alpha 1,4-glycosyltransferase conserved region